MRQALACAKIVLENNTITNSAADMEGKERSRESGGRLAALEGLKGITLQELVADHVHRGRVLYGQFSEKPIMQAELHTCFEDEFGSKVSVLVDNAWPRMMASPQECEVPFPKGLKVAIKEPDYSKGDCGGVCLRVSNPGKIVRIPNYKDYGAGPDSKDEAKVLELLESIRFEGNKLFGIEDWVGAVARYSECIALGMGDPVESWPKNLKNEKCLAYSNRAEALLRFKDFVGALSDTESALELNPAHAKSLTRQGRAAMQVSLYEKAFKAFEAALKLCPDDDSIVKSLQASRRLREQYLNGKFQNVPMESLGKTRKKYVEYIGPVEVRRVNYGDGRRGLYAKKPIKAYSVVMRTIAMAEGTRDPGKVPTSNVDSSGGFRGYSFGYGRDNGLLMQLLQRAAASKRSLAQLYSLASEGDGEKEIPSMELFKLGSEWAPSSADTLEVNVNHIKKILRFNGFYCNYSSDESARDSKECEDKAAMAGGLWILQSFINHSWVPNCYQTVNEGNSGYICAFRDIGPGEELTIGYFLGMFAGLERRQKCAEVFAFTCKCERCLLETQLNPEFAQISAQVGSLVSDSKYEIACDRGHEQFSLFGSLNSMYMQSANPNARFSKTRQLADLADRVEALIGLLDDKVATHQRNWVRGGFLEAYLAKYMLVRKLEPESSARIDTLSTIVKSAISICTNDATLTLAQLLMHEVKGRYSDDSKIYRETKGLVLQAIKVHYGIEDSARTWNGMMSAFPEFDYCKFSFNLEC